MNEYIAFIREAAFCNWENSTTKLYEHINILKIKYSNNHSTLVYSKFWVTKCQKICGIVSHNEFHSTVEF